jgi:hypothetical protein
VPRNSKIGVVGLMFAGLLLAACTGQVPGNAGSEVGTSTTTSETTSSSAKPPTRPGVIKVDGLDPCQGLTADQMKQLLVDRSVRNDTDLVKKGKVPVCRFSSRETGNGYSVGYIANESLDYWRSGSGNVDKKNVQIAGYDSIRINLSGASADCSFWIDVADGQILYVDYIPLDSKSLDEVCGKAQQGAEMALATLKTLR